MRPTNDLLYRFLKIYARLLMPIFCRKLLVKNAHLLKSRGPMLLSVNHPNSFLDAIILDILFEQPIFSLARGDAFQQAAIAKILRSLNMLPVYREREGKNNLHRNYDTFDSCIQIFRQGGVVLIFTEALCKNEWHLRPLKKGTARLAVSAWQQEIPLRILPIGINYSSFTLFGKNVHVNIGEPISSKDLKTSPAENGKLLNEINEEIGRQLSGLVYEIQPGDSVQLSATFQTPVSPFLRLLLILPALLGIVTHYPLYLPIHQFCKRKFRALDHYDSAMAGLLLLLYPVYLGVLGLIAVMLTNSWWGLISLVMLPFCAWSFVQVKQQTGAS